MLVNEEFRFDKITDKDLLDFINNSKEKIIIAKAAYSKKEIETIIRNIKNKGIVSYLYLESDDKAIRSGLGETESLELIRNNLNILNVKIVDKIRIGILIVDEKLLVYSQDINTIEKSKLELPNGFFLGKGAAEHIINHLDINLSDSFLNEEKSEIAASVERNSKEIIGSVGETIKNLKDNPPTDFNKLKKLNFYRNKYKLVKLQVFGIKIKNRKITLRPFNAMLENQYERLITSWNIFCEDDLKKLKDTKLFQLELKKITETYLLNAGRFGYILDLTKKQYFDKEIKKLQEEFLDFFKGINKENKNNRFYKSVKANNNNEDTLKSILNKSRSDLYDYLLKISRNDNGFLNEIYNKDRLLILDKENLSEDEMRGKFIGRYIINNLKFPSPQDIINRIDIKVDYYDISEELIMENNDFKEIVSHCRNNVRQIMIE